MVLNHFTWVYVAIIELPHLTEFRVRPIDLPDSTWVTLPYSSAVPLLGRVFYRPNAESLVWATRGKLCSVPVERDIVDEVLVFWRDHGGRVHGRDWRSGYWIVVGLWCYFYLVLFARLADPRPSRLESWIWIIITSTFNNSVTIHDSMNWEFDWNPIFRRIHFWQVW